MITHPTALELIDAVIGFIEQRAAPHLKDRDAFHARVAVNALATVRREIEFGPLAEANAVQRLEAIFGHKGAFSELNEALVAGIEDGSLDAADPAVAAHLKASIIDQVRIDQPNYSGLKALAG